MAWRLPPLAVLLLLVAAAVAPLSSAVRPVSDAHRSVAAELFAASPDDLETTYEAVRTFKMLGVQRDKGLDGKACKLAAHTLSSSSSPAKDLFQAVQIAGVLGCSVDAGVYDDVASRLKAVIKDTDSLLEFYYSVGGLLSLKEQGHSVVLSDADSTFHAIKALSQSDGRWRYDTNSAESSTFAAGIALEALAGVVSLSDAEVDPSMIGVVKNDIVKLFGTIKSYDDGTFYFDEKYVDGSEYKGPITTSASVVRGVTSFANVVSGKLNIPGEKILGLAKFFLGIGLPGSAKDCFNQIESLSLLENNRIFVPLILSLPSKVLSLTSKDQLKVEVTTVFGSAAPPLRVNLVQVLGSDSKIITTDSKELQFDLDNNVHYLDITPLKIDVGKYSLVFEITLQDSEHETVYTTGGRNTESVVVTGLIKVDKAEIGISENDAGSAESVEKLDLLKDTKVSLSANHLQKLRLSFQLSTPLGRTFKPHQDFLGLVEKFYYLSGTYDLELSVGDASMENSFLRALGQLELDLPEAPEKAPRPPAQAVDPLAKFRPQKEIEHIFRVPEKRPLQEVSLAFTGLTLLPFIGFLIGLMRLGVNLKNFPSLPGPAAFASLFHAGIAAVLLLYVLFWVKVSIFLVVKQNCTNKGLLTIILLLEQLDLFTTLKYLSFLGVFLVFVGHRTLSHLSNTTAKQKTA
uniref:Dolichyl-diphosphooligosaccharide--protein glycosyltransferase subunit 2 n=1 Tax=Aegilops tauschii TaxID=37682 RepID=M8AK97_AEGTA